MDITDIERGKRYDNTRVKAPNCTRIWISRDPSAIWHLNERVIIPEFNIVDILFISDILLCDLMFIL